MKPDPEGQPLMIGETCEEQVRLLREYRQEVFDLIDKLPFKEKDARRVLLNNLIGPVCVYISMLNLSFWGAAHRQDFMKILDINNPSGIEDGEQDMFRAGKLYYVVDSQFQIENGFKHLLNAMKYKLKKPGYWHIAHGILDATGIAEADKKFQALYTPASIRNCLHNNGIHNQESITYKVGDVAYSFVKDKRVTCAKLEYVVHAFRGTLAVIGEIVLSPASKSEGFIPEAYTQQLDHTA